MNYEGGNREEDGDLVPYEEFKGNQGGDNEEEDEGEGEGDDEESGKDDRSNK